MQATRYYSEIGCYTITCCTVVGSAHGYLKNKKTAVIFERPLEAAVEYLVITTAGVGTDPFRENNENFWGLWRANRHLI